MQHYRATINYDFSGTDTKQSAKLTAALFAAGWVHVETSAFIIDTDEIGRVGRGIEVFAKQASSIGNFSALTYHIQASQNFSQSSYPDPSNAPDALTEIRNKTFP